MLHGRVPEMSLVDGLLADVRAARSRTLVIRGEPGIGKSTLLHWAAQRAAPAQVLRAGGVESEVELPFALLHQLLYPVLGRIEALPEVQARALRGALGLAPGGAADRFLVAVGVLTLLADVAGDQGLVCTVDDAQWVDAASLAALVFVARRLEAEGVGLIFATRGGPDDLAGLSDVTLTGLDEESAGALLAAGRPAANHVRQRLIRETAGNPLALVELPQALTAGQLSGDEALPETLPVSEGVERVFAGVAARLPAPARILLTVAAADDTGRIAVIGRAAAALGVGPDGLVPAEESGLIRVTGDRVEFRHPLARSALYQQAGFGTRQAIHRALATALDGAAADSADVDRRTWHLATAAIEPDEAIADALEESAGRALRRAGATTAAAALLRAAELTATPGERGRRLVAAAESAWTAGRPAQALTLLDRADPLVGDPAPGHGLRGLIELSSGRPDTAYPLLVAAATSTDDPRARLARLALAGEAAALSGDPRRISELAELARALPAAPPADRNDAAGPGDHPAGMADGDRLVIDMLTGVASASRGDWTAASARLRAVVQTADGGDQPLTLLRAGQAAMLLGDVDAGRRLYQRAADIARGTGAIGLLATALDRLAFGLIMAGRIADAEIAGAEGLRLAGELDQQQATAHAVLALLAAWRGDADTCRRHTEHALAQAQAMQLGAVTAGAGWALGLLELGQGRPLDALHRLAPVVNGTDGAPNGIALWATPDLVEASARAGQPAHGRAPLARFGAWAQRVGAPWAIEAARRGAAQLDLAGPDEFARALDGSAGGRPLERARTLLAYGESLRRARRRADARVALRTALETFDRAGATPWADRARTELRATGETLGSSSRDMRTSLTPQELQIARLAAAGASNPDIARQLFLSRKTVEYHLHKVFTKLGVVNRWELTRVELAELAAVEPRPG